MTGRGADRATPATGRPHRMRRSRRMHAAFATPLGGHAGRAQGVMRLPVFMTSRRWCRASGGLRRRGRRGWGAGIMREASYLGVAAVVLAAVVAAWPVRAFAQQSAEPRIGNADLGGGV